MTALALRWSALPARQPAWTSMHSELLRLPAVTWRLGLLQSV
ncbi:hypothetical protein LMG31884_23220 [Xanthomonas hydrangeae]|nr:hypothetical protein LMG31884_23220 [Xanthomonas hydrangeae]CAD7716755.1 hypothetical protein LMG31884_23220 [Xanthomonas hydrangeae]